MAAGDPPMAGAKLHCSSRLWFSFSVSVVAAPGLKRRGEEDEGVAKDQAVGSIFRRGFGCSWPTGS